MDIAPFSSAPTSRNLRIKAHGLRPFVCSKIHARLGATVKMLYCYSCVGICRKLLQVSEAAKSGRAGAGRRSKRGARGLSSTAQNSHHRRVFAEQAAWRRFHDAGTLDLDLALKLVVHKGHVVLGVLKIGNLSDNLLYHLHLLPDICGKAGANLQSAILAFSMPTLVKDPCGYCQYKSDARWHPCVHWGRQRYRVLLENMKKWSTSGQPKK